MMEADRASDSRDAAAIDFAKLRWRCRRGTRELDALYRWFLDHRWEKADATSKAAFARLVEAEDPVVWDWCVGRARSIDAAEQEVIDDIRAHHRL